MSLVVALSMTLWLLTEMRSRQLHNQNICLIMVAPDFPGTDSETEIEIVL